MVFKKNEQSKSKLSHLLLKWLGIPDKFYSVEDIKNAIFNKCNADSQAKKYMVVTLDDEGKMLFNIPTNPARIQTIITCIGYKYMINYQKPAYEHYEYNQSPSNVTMLKL